MRVVEVIHPNTQIRTFTCDKEITSNRIALFSTDAKATNKEKKLFNNILAINLVDRELSISDYSIRIEIVDAFSESEEDWKHIRENVLVLIADYFEIKQEDIDFSTKDDRKKYEEKKEEVPDFFSVKGLFNVLNKQAIPEAFFSRKTAWRLGLETMLEQAKNSNLTNQVAYLEAELLTFDTAFSQLEKLDLPTRR